MLLLSRQCFGGCAHPAESLLAEMVRGRQNRVHQFNSGRWLREIKHLARSGRAGKFRVSVSAVSATPGNRALASTRAAASDRGKRASLQNSAPPKSARLSASCSATICRIRRSWASVSRDRQSHSPLSDYKCRCSTSKSSRRSSRERRRPARSRCRSMMTSPRCCGRPGRCICSGCMPAR